MVMHPQISSFYSRSSNVFVSRGKSYILFIDKDSPGMSLVQQSVTVYTLLTNQVKS